MMSFVASHDTEEVELTSSAENPQSPFMIRSTRLSSTYNFSITGSQSFLYFTSQAGASSGGIDWPVYLTMR